MTGSKGWFVVGDRDGARTLREQMYGLQPAIDEVHQGMTVLDLGCAEGLIAMEFAKAGATVRGIEYNPDLAAMARELTRAVPKVTIDERDLRDEIAAPERRRYDVVLALAILHKLRNIEAAILYCAAVARSLVIVRLPLGSTGKIRCKYEPEVVADLRATMDKCGFDLERDELGPRTERVHYYRRREAC